jgi:hypothetical protein
MCFGGGQTYACALERRGKLATPREFEHGVYVVERGVLVVNNSLLNQRAGRSVQSFARAVRALSRFMPQSAANPGC